MAARMLEDFWVKGSQSAMSAQWTHSFMYDSLCMFWFYDI
jgi:hypothetical protein